MSNAIIQEQLLDDTIKCIELMVKDWKWRYDQSGVEGNYSPELKKAIDVLDKLKAEQAKL